MKIEKKLITNSINGVYREHSNKIRCPEASCRALVSKKYDYCPNCGCKLKGYKLGEIFDMVRYKIDETLDKK